ncbi:uncharacterized protein LOC142229732 [Haematobia irritans]|uniref:uncharacterized protein LOC142229732 n=1 Tax=Haematobia irritans TaxID=7368 RepID=UPI003F508FB6
MNLFNIVWIWSTILVAICQAGAIGHSEAHDFSEGLEKSASSNYGSLGSLGDHLDQSHFPADFGESQHGDEYAEGSEHFEIPHHEVLEDHHDFHPHSFEHESLSHHDIHSDLHDFDTKPVPGINHGKGALSYSTTYEFKDPKP